MKKPGTIIYATLGVLVLFGAGMILLFSEQVRTPVQDSVAPIAEPMTPAPPTHVGGAAVALGDTPASTLPSAFTSPSAFTLPSAALLSAGPVATMTDAVPAAYVKQAASVMEALQDGKHPERLSPHYLPAKFDAARFAVDREFYINTVEPARIYDTAEATGPESVHLVLEGPERVAVLENGVATLVVRGAPHSPVTYTTMHGGFFDNKMASITVMTDAEGRAAVTYTAFMNIADVGIGIGSPMSVGTISMVVEVLRQRRGAAVITPPPTGEHAL